MSATYFPSREIWRQYSSLRLNPKWPWSDTKDLNIDVNIDGKFHEFHAKFDVKFNVCDFSPAAKFDDKFHVCGFSPVLAKKKMAGEKARYHNDFEVDLVLA